MVLIERLALILAAALSQASATKAESSSKATDSGTFQLQAGTSEDLTKATAAKAVFEKTAGRTAPETLRGLVGQKLLPGALENRARRASNIVHSTRECCGAHPGLLLQPLFRSYLLRLSWLYIF